MSDFTNYYDPGTGDYVVIDGMIVERKASDIVQKIQEYDPDLEVFYCDPDKAEFNDAPYVLCWRDEKGVLKKVFEFWELDDRVIERIYNADRNRFDAFAKMTQIEEQLKKAKEDRYQEVRQTNVELFKDILRSPQSSYSFKNKEGDLVRINERGPVVKNNAKKSFSEVGNHASE